MLIQEGAEIVLWARICLHGECQTFLHSFIWFNSDSFLLAVGRTTALEHIVILYTTKVVWVEFWSSWNLTSKLLKSLALGLWDKESSEEAAEHKESEYLHNVIEPWGCGAAGWGTTSTERSDKTLGKDGTDLSGGSGDTMRCGSVTSREALPWNDESRRIWSEVEEELSEDVESQKAVWTELVESKTDDKEENGEDGETT
jgi:hypothetical protein